MPTITFQVPGIPFGKQRARAYKTPAGFIKHYTPQETINYEALCGMCAAEARNQQNDGKMLTAPIVVKVKAHFPVPESRKKKLVEGQPHCQKPDADNVLKALCDSGSGGILWNDDCGVFEKHISKHWTHEAPRLEVEVSGS